MLYAAYAGALQNSTLHATNRASVKRVSDTISRCSDTGILFFFSAAP